MVALAGWCSIPRCQAHCRGDLGCILLVYPIVVSLHIYDICIYFCIYMIYAEIYVCLDIERGPNSHLPKACLVSDLLGNIILLVKPGDVFGREMGNLGAFSFASCIRAGDAGHRYGSRGGNVLWLLLTWHLSRRISGVDMHPDGSAHSLCMALHWPPGTVGTARGLADWGLPHLKANSNSNCKICQHWDPFVLPREVNRVHINVYSVITSDCLLGTADHAI